MVVVVAAAYQNQISKVASNRALFVVVLINLLQVEGMELKL